MTGRVQFVLLAWSHHVVRCADCTELQLNRGERWMTPVRARFLRAVYAP
jgi:hypothetical protein